MAPIRTRMNRIFFVNRYFHPDVSATSALVSDLAFDLATERQVHVITSQQCYDNPKFRLPAAEIIHNVHITRVPTTQFGRARLIGRAIDYLSFYAAAWRALRNLVQRDDVVVAMTDPPLLSIVAMQAAKRRVTRFSRPYVGRRRRWRRLSATSGHAGRKGRCALGHVPEGRLVPRQLRGRCPATN